MSADTRHTPYELPDDVWLLNLGYVSEHAEQNLMLYGYIACPGIVNVELMVDVAHTRMLYATVLDRKAHFLYQIQQTLARKPSILRKLVLLAFLKFFGSYDPAVRIARCVRDYAGPTWKTQVEVISAKRYLKVVSSDRAKGWFFKDGIDEDTGVRELGGAQAPAAPRGGEDVRDLPRRSVVPRSLEDVP